MDNNAAHQAELLTCNCRVPIYSVPIYIYSGAVIPDLEITPDLAIPRFRDGRRTAL